ncbi:uncharacterized protein [Thunnus thynnus]|uniref:uncharacterized protein n=1 Tax=Thunnus thynnus TaxID=8237 RepID=UPI003529BD65
MQPKPNSLHQERTTRLPDSVQHKEPVQPSCIEPNLDSTCGQSAYGERSEAGKTTKSHPSDLYTSSTASYHIHTTKKEKLRQLPNLNWKEKRDEKEEHRHHQLDSCLNVLPLKEKSRGHTVVTPELDGRHDTVSHDRKRPLDCGSLIKVKRVKQEVVDDRFDPSLLSMTRKDPSSNTMLVQHINTSDTSALHCYSSGCNVARAPRGVVSYPGAEMYPYQTASWEQLWTGFKTMDHSLRQQLLGDYLLNSCKVIKMPRAAQKHKEVFHSFSAPHLRFPLAIRQQETAYLSGRKFMSSGNESHHLHHCHSATMSHLLHPGFLAASHTGC